MYNNNKIKEESSSKYEIGEKLSFLNKYNGTVVTYENLPQCARKSVDIYYKDEFGYEINPDDMFYYAEIPTEQLKKSIGCPNDLPYKTFEEYHKWYMDGGDIPNHKEVWAIILSSDEYEVIFDGWHRFHHYVDIGINMIPAIHPIYVEEFTKGDNK